MTKRLLTLFLSLSIIVPSCEGSETEATVVESTETSDDLTTNADGTVRFYLSEDGCRYSLGATSRDWVSSTVNVNGVEYAPSQDADGTWYVDVTEHSSGSYTAALFTGEDPAWCEESVYLPFLPFSQFMEGTASDLASFPMYAVFSSDSGNSLTFKDAFAVLDLSLSGDATIVSVKVEDVGGSEIAGYCVYTPSIGVLSPSGGLDFIVLNCTDGTATLSSSGTHFYILMAPGTYSQGLRVTVSDSDHGAMEQETGSITLTANEFTSLSLSYELGDVVFWETFDNFVWGGDPVGGNVGYSPDGTTPSAASSPGWNGYENALVEVAYNVPGSSYIQSATYTDTEGLTVGTSANPLMPYSYTTSRNVNDYRYLFRCREHPGYIAAGTASTTRGAVSTPDMSRLEGRCEVTLSFDVCGQSGIADDFLFKVYGSGTMTSVQWDGTELSLDDGAYIYYYTGNESYVFPNSLIASGAGSVWHHVTVNISDATGGTYFYFAGNVTSAMVHGFYLDNIKLTCQSTDFEERGDLRVLYWNIQCGMWADQPNDYDNFVAWVQKYDPDVCVWCEAGSVFEDYTETTSTDRYLPNGWSELAARYGHSYVAMSGKRDSGPQEITSKYPITVLEQITDTDTSGKPIAHGAGMYQITVGGREISLVSLHLWPYEYGFGASDTSASAEANEGDYYREYEIKYLLSRTVQAEGYSGISDWLMMGDFNCRSRVDNWYYGYSEDDSEFLAQDVMINDSGLLDVVYNRYPDRFVPSTGWPLRLDYVYASQDMYDSIASVWTVLDSWTVVKTTDISWLYNPSDHLPIIIDFDL